MKRLSVRILHFAEGIAQLGGRMSVSAGNVQGGPSKVDSIERNGTGYLIGHQGRLFFVSDGQVKVAEVVDLDAEAAKEPPARAGREVPPLLSADVGAGAPIPSSPIGATPGEIVMDARGVFSRVTQPVDVTRFEPAQVETEQDARGQVENAPPFRPKKRRAGPKPEVS